MGAGASASWHHDADASAIFTKYDENSDGLLSLDELQAAVKGANLGDWSEERIKATIDLYDVDGDKNLNLSEFTEVITHLKAKTGVTKYDLQELKALPKPPQAVADMLRCAYHLAYGSPAEDDAAVKKAMSNTNQFLNQMGSVDSEKIAATTVKDKVATEMAKIDADQIAKVCRAAIALDAWCRAMVK